jgi:hypothetical protein
MANQPQQSQPQSGQTQHGDTVTGGIVTGLGQQSQAQQHSQQQIAQAYQQHAQALGLPAGIDWHRLVPLIVQLIQAVMSGGGVMPQAQAGQQPSP